MFPIKHFGLSLLSVLLIISLWGCNSGSELKRYPVTGSISYKGKPVVLGEISFNPDTSVGNAGPASFSAIKDGKFSISPELGVVGGQYKISIAVYEGIPDASGENNLGKLLAKVNDLKIELKQGENTFDYDLTK